jgi:alkanesulfonate monooxygenase SsuD/methylene tetrahydromethanopterin reductase-like flavin-dependent oxidoreductase (luciferase family)
VRIGTQYMGDSGGPKAFARRAEDAGFDSVWCGDHVGHLVDGIAALGCFAGATERITIGVDLLVVPYRPAAVIAKGLATIASVASGRVVAGFGVGGEFPEQFAATGAELRTRGAYTEDALDVVRRLWRGAPLHHRSRWAHFDGFTLEPAPGPGPRPTGVGRRPLRRRAPTGGARRDGYVPYLVSPRQFERRRPGGGLQRYVDVGVDHVILGCLPGSPSEIDEFFAASSRLLPSFRRLQRRRT